MGQAVLPVTNWLSVPAVCQVNQHLQREMLDLPVGLPPMKVTSPVVAEVTVEQTKLPARTLAEVSLFRLVLEEETRQRHLQPAAY
jgi:hypothetical protein